MSNDSLKSTEELAAEVFGKITRTAGSGPDGPDLGEVESRRLEGETNIPIRHSRAVLKEEGPWLHTLNAISERRGRGFLMALVSSRGNGKTQIGVELIKRSKHGYYCTATEFFLAVKEAEKADSKLSEGDVVKRFRKPQLLVIDEVAKRKESEWEFQLLFELINKRYGDMTDTLLISNQSPLVFRDVIGPSLASRMKETGGIVECNWESFRV